MARRVETARWDRAGGIAAVALAAAVLVAGVPGSAAAVCTGESSFDGDRFVDQRGDLVAVRVEHCGTGDRSVEIEGDGYSATVSIRDGDGDDVVTVLVNSFAPGEDGLGVANPADDFFVRSVDGADGPLATAEYDLRVVEVSYDQRTVEDEATMVVEDRSLGRLSVLAAPGGARSDLDTPGAVRTALADGTVANRTPFVDDVAVLVLDASGVAGALADEDGPNATARFLAVADGSTLSLRAVERGPTVDTEEAPVALPVGYPNVTRVVPDATNDTYYVLVDLAAALAREAADGDGREVEVGDAFVANLSVPADSSLATDGPESVAARFEVARRTASLSRDERPVFLLPGENLTVNGTTNVRAGRTLTLAVEEPGPVGSFRQRTPVTVGPDGGFGTDVDLRFREDGANLTLSVRYEGRNLLGGPVRILVDEPDASVSLRNQTVEAGVVTVASVSLSRPGFVVLHSPVPGGDVLGVSDRLDRGSHRNVTVRLDADAAGSSGTLGAAAVVYRDADRDGTFEEQDPAFRRDRRPVNDRATLAVTGQQTPGTPTVAQTPPARPPGTPTDRPPVHTDPGLTPTATRTDADGGGNPIPGFGWATALAAVTAALVLARRR